MEPAQCPETPEGGGQNRVELTPAERQRIAEEERVRLEVRERFKEKKRLGCCLGVLALLAVVAIPYLVGGIDRVAASLVQTVLSAIVSGPTKRPSEIQELDARGRTIRVGDLADDVVKVLGPEDEPFAPRVQPDLAIRGSLVVTHVFSLEDRVAWIEYRRMVSENGPYRVSRLWSIQKRNLNNITDAEESVRADQEGRVATSPSP